MTDSFSWQGQNGSSGESSQSSAGQLSIRSIKQHYLPIHDRFCQFHSRRLKSVSTNHHRQSRVKVKGKRYQQLWLLLRSCKIKDINLGSLLTSLNHGILIDHLAITVNITHGRRDNLTKQRSNFRRAS